MIGLKKKFSISLKRKRKGDVNIDKKNNRPAGIPGIL